MNLILFPVILPLLAAALTLVAFKRLRLQQYMTGVVSLLLFVYASWLMQRLSGGEILVVRLGGWPGTFGIVFAADILSGIMLWLSAVLMVVSFFYTIAGGMAREGQHRFFYPLFLILASGVNWAFLTADLFNLFVAFELVLLCSYGMLSHANRASELRESFRFAVLNIIGGTFFLAVCGLMYGTFGTLNFADLSLKLRATDQQGMVLALGSLLLVVFGMKAAIFPLFFWLPEAYPRAPLGIIPYFSGILTKVGVYCLYRVYTLVFGENPETWFQPLLLLIAGSTMVIGVLGALGQWTFRHILAFHSVSQIGYMIFGLALFTPLGLAGGILFVVHHSLVKSSLFLLSGIVYLSRGSDHLKEVKGLMRAHPFLAILFFLAAMSLAGLPPLSGFFGKYILVLEGFSEGWIAVTIASIFTSILTLASMVKIWNYSFLGAEEAQPALNGGMVAVSAAFIALLAVFPFAAGWLTSICEQAAVQLFDGTAYLDAVLGTDAALASIPPIPGEGP